MQILQVIKHDISLISETKSLTLNQSASLINSEKQCKKKRKYVNVFLIKNNFN